MTEGCITCTACVEPGTDVYRARQLVKERLGSEAAVWAGGRAAGKEVWVRWPAVGRFERRCRQASGLGVGGFRRSSQQLRHLLGRGAPAQGVCPGRPLSGAATGSSSVWSWARRSVRLGSTGRSRPMVFSLPPRS